MQALHCRVGRNRNNTGIIHNMSVALMLFDVAIAKAANLERRLLEKTMIVQFSLIKCFGIQNKGHTNVFSIFNSCQNLPRQVGVSVTLFSA